jgi:polyferredoxin
VKAYSVVLTVLVTVFVYLLTTRTEIEAIITRVPGILFARVDDATTSNMYSYKVVNKTFDDKEMELKVVSPATAQLRLFNEFATIAEQSISEGRFMILMPNTELQAGKATIVLGLYVDGKLIENLETRFTGPQ